MRTQKITVTGKPALFTLARNCVLRLCFLFLANIVVFAQAPPSNELPAAPSSSPYQPITSQQRLKWFVTGTIGVRSLAGGVISAGWGTGFNNPREYHGTWEGFGKRYGMRLTGISTGNAMEATLGALWHEDPRYFPATGQPFKERVRHVIVTTFTAPRTDGSYGPAFARFVAIPGNNFLSNTWRADSEATNRDAALRTLYGVLGRMGSDAFAEFWPDVQRLIFRKKQPGTNR